MNLCINSYICIYISSMYEYLWLYIYVFITEGEERVSLESFIIIIKWEIQCMCILVFLL